MGGKPGAISKQEDEKRMMKLKVMLADDEAVILEGLLKLFDWAGHGFQVQGVCGDGITALNTALATQPDILIVDINMPLLSGLDVIRSLSGSLPETVCIILSGYDEFEYAKEALKLKVTDYLLKPVRFDELERVLDQVRVDILHRRTGQIAHREPQLSEDTPLLNRIVAYIGEHLDEEITLSHLAQEFGMNAAYFSQFFKNKTGMNFHKYLTMQRISQAKQLLSSTERSITDIAAAVGIADYRVFSKAFKRQQGITPSEYRQNT